MSRPLSYRRAQENRALHKAYRVVCLWFPQGSFNNSTGTYYGGLFTPECRWDMARRIAPNRKKCSGQCCKNPRRTKWHSITMQEKKALEDYYSQLEDLLL